MPRTLITLLVLALAPACAISAYHDLTDSIVDDSATTTDDGASTTDGASISAGDPTNSISTVTTDSTSTSTTDATESDGPDPTTTGATTSATDPTDTDPPPDNAPPYIHWLFANPAVISKAGPVELTALTSDDVSDIDLYLDDELVAVLAPGDFPYTHVVTRAAQNGHREFTIRVRDPEGLEAVSMPAAVDVSLPESGSPVWKLIGKDPQWAEAHAIAPFADGVAVGGFLAQNGLSTPIIRRYDASNTLAWTANPIAKNGIVTGLAATPDGQLIAIGIVDDGGLYPWIAGLDEAHNPTFGPIYGNVNETATAVAVAADGSIYVSGYIQTLDKGKFDAMLWAYGPHGEPKWFRLWDNPGFDNPGEGRDQAHALAVLMDGSIAIAGETTVRDEILPALTDTRAFVLRYAASNALLDSWVAGKYPAKHSGALAIAADSDGGVLVGGWSGFSPNSVTTPLSIRLDADLAPVWYRQELTGQGGLESIAGIGRLPEGKIVIALNMQGSGSQDIVLRAFEEQGDVAWEHLHTPSNAEDRVNDLAFGRYGAIYFAGASGSSKIVAGELAP